MINEPATVLEVAAADRFSIDRELEKRALPIAERFCRVTGKPALPAVRLTVLKRAPAHSGFGSGTQLSLSIADGLRAISNESISDETLATQIADRGKRSAVGVHGFFHGGLISESGNQGDRRLNQVQTRVELPTDWRLLLLRPVCHSATVSGDRERKKFAALRPNPEATHRLREQINRNVIPAAQAADFAAFAGAIQSYNHASGMLFAAAQGGPYNGPEVTRLIEALKAVGAGGIGQSSWGPGVFAWCENESTAQSLAQVFGGPDLDVRITSVRNTGRQLTRST